MKHWQEREREREREVRSGRLAVTKGATPFTQTNKAERYE
jgi:hypothetical protein